MLKISACVIVKNEEKNIGRWLDGMRQVADEMIVVDTGSEDNTAAIARKAGARVVLFAWHDDFSAAKNFAIEQARGEWIVFPDADEYFAEPSRVRDFLLQNIDAACEAWMVTMINQDEDRRGEEIQRFVNVRCFRNCSALRYEGRVHETLHRAAGDIAYDMMPADLVLYHTGYSSHLIQQKMQRNWRLLQADIALQGEGPQHYRYLADCYFGFYNYEQALHYAQLAITAPLQSLGSASDMYYIVLESLRYLKRPMTERLQWIEQGIQRFPDLPDFYAERGMLFAEQKRDEIAAADLKKALQLLEEPRKTAEATRLFGMRDRVYARLGEIYKRQGAKEKALQAFAKALQTNRYNGEALSGWVSLSPDTDPSSLAAGLEPFFASGLADTEYLAGWARREDNVPLYLVYARQLREQYSRPDVLEPVYEAAGRGDSTAVYEQVMQLAPRYLQELFVALLYLADQKKIPETVQMLPASLIRVVGRYGGEEKPLTAADYDSYQAMLPAVMAGGTAEQIQRYAVVAVDFPADRQYATAGLLYAGRQWAAAMELYQQVPADSPLVTAEFWHNVGICLYYEGENAAAQESLQRAQALGDSGKDTAAYLSWLEAADRAETVGGDQNT